MDLLKKVHGAPAFIRIGYSIRGVCSQHYKIFKPGTNVVSYDGMICKPHPQMKHCGERIGDIYNLEFDLLYDYGKIKELYLKITDNKRYSLYEYALHKDDILKYDELIFYESDRMETVDHKFAYALVNPVSPEGLLLGYDIIDADLGGISALVNCDIDWRIAEECGELNEYNLFSQYDDAACFRAKADELVQEHAPFGVMGIYRPLLDA